MQTHLQNSILFLLPFFVLVLVNECSRLDSAATIPYQHRGITAINSEVVLPNQCTWQCHHSTQHCKQQHVKHLKSHFHYTDPLYFGIIHSFKMTGNYGVANVLVLVMLLPSLMYILLVKSLNIQAKIKQYRLNTKTK